MNGSDTLNAPRQSMNSKAHPIPPLGSPRPSIPTPSIGSSSAERVPEYRSCARASNVLSPSTLAPEVILAIQMDTRARKLP